MSLLRDFKPRLYQETIFGSCAIKNCLVVLPTGLGKTAIALMLAAQRLVQYPQSKIVMLAPTKPLAEQHLKTFRKHLAVDQDRIVLFTGETPPNERATAWPGAKIVFCTPQGLENDIISNRVSLADVSLLVFDEAHHAVGDYSYVFLAKQYVKQAQFCRILGLTASPGTEIEHIEEVCKNLFIEDVEVRTTKDHDVAQYVQEMAIDWVKVDLSSELQDIRQILLKCYKQRSNALVSFGATGLHTSKKDLLTMQRELATRMASGDRSMDVLKALSVLAEAIKIQHALELLETQSLRSLERYFVKLQGDAALAKSKAVRNVVQDENFKVAVIKTRTLLEKKIEHPKLARLRKAIEEEFVKDKLRKIIVFTQYRESAVGIKEELQSISHCVPEVFVGQAKKGTTGLSQKKQIEMLEQFRLGLFNVLIATSVAEEGLDIPRVDLVLFYEPIPSAIRLIQRRGRTGRQDSGRVQILMTAGTRDEAFHYSAIRKEKNMHRLLTTIRSSMKGGQHVLPQLTRTLPQQSASSQQQTLFSFSKEVVPVSKIVVYADQREKSNRIVKELLELNTDIRLETLSTADYILSNKVGVEFKTQQDFVDSLLDGRLLDQVSRLKENFARPILVIEGTGSLYTVRNVHPNAIRGTLAAITVSQGIPILFTSDAKDTAELLYTIAKREQETTPQEFSPHASRKPMSLKESQEYIISAFPNIGPNLAKQLLRQFKSVRNVINASETELASIEGIGVKKAKGIRETSDREYSL